ncbi:unnamed protein product [Phyllotreta striolata]|uniref:CCHC-type domain-containing protein n=1 Tax=Phyllotreta striolata TaxID=444603 RepID=A0A9N9XKG2_PHYSR|nr:unnamed protein product [Phyllotreta striolata]
MASDSGGPSGPLGRPPDIPKRYKYLDTGPYLVIVEGTDKNNIGAFHPIAVGRTLRIKGIQGIKAVSRKGSNRISIEFITSKYSNEFLDNDKLKEESKWESYIPASLVTSRRIIRGIDLSTSMEEIKNFGKASTKILDARRLNRRIANQQTVEYVPSETELITFEGKNIPNTVSINYYESRVKVYVGPVLQCFNCLRYGHSSKQCRSHIRCSRCGEEHEATNCQKDIKCIFCKLEHLATDRKQCAEFERQKQIKEIMCYENLSYYEASKREQQKKNATIDQKQLHHSKRKKTEYRDQKETGILTTDIKLQQGSTYRMSVSTTMQNLHYTNSKHKRVSKKPKHTTLTTEQIDKVIDETQSIEFEKIDDKTNENMATSPIPSEDWSTF